MNKYDVDFKELLQLTPPGPSTPPKWLWSKTSPAEELAKKMHVWFASFATHFFEVKGVHDLASLQDLSQRIAPKIALCEKLPELATIVKQFQTLFTSVLNHRWEFGDTLRKTQSSDVVLATITPRLVPNIGLAAGLKIAREKSGNDEAHVKEEKVKDDYRLKLTGLLSQAASKGEHYFYTKLMEVENPIHVRIWGEKLDGVQVAGITERALTNQPELRSKLIYLIPSLNVDQLPSFYATLPENFYPLLRKVLREPCKVVYLGDVPHIVYPGMSNPPPGPQFDESMKVQEKVRKQLNVHLNYLGKLSGEILAEYAVLKSKISAETFRKAPELIEKILEQLETKINSGARLVENLKKTFTNGELNDHVLCSGEQLFDFEVAFDGFKQDIQYTPGKGIWKALDEFYKGLEVPNEDDDLMVEFPFNVLVRLNVFNMKHYYKVGLFANVSEDDYNILTGKKNALMNTKPLTQQVEVNLRILGLTSYAAFKEHRLFSRQSLKKFCTANRDKLLAHPFQMPS